MDTRMKIVLYGAGSLVAGVLLYFALIYLQLNYYEEQPRPGWLIASLWMAVGLAAIGLLTLASAAAGASRKRR
jgi:hypothetical protein